MAKGATTTTAPGTPGEPGVGVSFSCPAPGTGYTATFTWPPGGVSGLDWYTITVTSNGAPVSSQRWGIEAVAPDPVPALPPGAPRFGAAGAGAVEVGLHGPDDDSEVDDAQSVLGHSGDEHPATGGDTEAVREARGERKAATAVDGDGDARLPTG